MALLEAVKSASVALVLLVLIQALAQVCDGSPTTSSTSTPSMPGGIHIQPRYVCNPRCVGYYENDDISSFLSDRCCIFIPCPMTGGYDRDGYNDFKSQVCSES